MAPSIITQINHKQRKEILIAYRNEVCKESESVEELIVKRGKTGVRIQDLKGINLVNGKKILIGTHHVMMGYGTETWQYLLTPPAWLSDCHEEWHDIHLSPRPKVEIFPKKLPKVRDGECCNSDIGTTLLCFIPVDALLKNLEKKGKLKVKF